MKKKMPGPKISWTIFSPLILILVLSGCLGSGSGSRTRLTDNLVDGSKGTTNTPTATIAPSFTPTPTALIIIQQLVDPADSTFKTKVSIPKNFSGQLLLSGLNFSSLSNKIVKVRFFLGKDVSAVTLPATLARHPSMIPQTGQQVLVMDLKDAPFNNVRLLYDLYDYTNYTSGQEPIQDPLATNNGSLYCRGLLLAHDPTFVNNPSECLTGPCAFQSTLCDSPSDICHYAFVKVIDAGLTDISAIARIPTNPSIDFTGKDYLSTNTSTADITTMNTSNLTKCLPDNGILNYIATNSGYNYQLYNQSSSALTAATGDSVLTLPGPSGTLVQYKYNGPYRLLSTDLWERKLTAAVGNVAFGAVFQKAGALSFLFPRAGVLPLRNNTTYLGSTVIFNSATDTNSVRTVKKLTASGNSLYMDGCSLRVSGYDPITSEGIQSCNVSAFIQVITVDSTGTEQILASTTGVKLQLMKASQKNSTGAEVLYQSLPSCQSSTACAANQCCFNSRCWLQTLVSQCLEDARVVGNLDIGSNCTTDLSCSSLCCNATGKCAVHNTSLNPQVFCSKLPGQTCVASPWCLRSSVSTPLLVITGKDSNGFVTCAVRNYVTLVNGSCINGICVAPVSPASINAPNPADPNACANAVNPPAAVGTP